MKRAASPRNDWSDWVTCPVTGKRGFRARKAAKAAARRGGLRDLSTYRCPDCNHFHLGHLPAGIRHGDYDRTQLHMSCHRRFT